MESAQKPSPTLSTLSPKMDVLIFGDVVNKFDALVELRESFAEKAIAVINPDQEFTNTFVKSLSGHEMEVLCVAVTVDGMKGF